MSETAEITESCGCVFCDFDLEPNAMVKGQPVHRKGRRWRYCTNTGASGARDALVEYERDGGKTLDEIGQELGL